MIKKKIENTDVDDEETIKHLIKNYANLETVLDIQSYMYIKFIYVCNCKAYYHDTTATYNSIKTKFSSAVADLVKEVTSMDKLLKKMGKPNYLADKMIKMSDNALIIKLADRFHNLTDLKKSSESFIQKTINQTYFIITRLRTDRKLNSHHKKLLRLIDKEIGKYNDNTDIQNKV
jgi:(p)ppGpp synthase/HD superfamily hydrolase